MDEFLRRRADRRMPAVLLPDTTLTDSRSPRKTTPVRRLTVNRKPLRNCLSLAQPRIPRNSPPLTCLLLRVPVLVTARNGFQSRFFRIAPAYSAAMALQEKYRCCARLLRSARI